MLTTADGCGTDSASTGRHISKYSSGLFSWCCDARSPLGPRRSRNPFRSRKPASDPKCRKRSDSKKLCSTTIIRMVLSRLQMIWSLYKSRFRAKNGKLLSSKVTWSSFKQKQRSSNLTCRRSNSSSRRFKDQASSPTTSSSPLRSASSSWSARETI